MMNPQESVLELALRYGTKLPKPGKLKLSPPAFSIGASHSVLFSPTGADLLVSTNGGCFLWDVTTGEKRLRLKAITNPSRFAFNADGSKLLMRNGQSQFAVFAVPSGELLNRFSAKYERRMDGQGCLGPDDRTVLQLAFEGVLLVLDAEHGKVLAEHQLEPTSYSGEVYWLPNGKQAVIAQRSIANRKNLSTPCALWRWQAPLLEHLPERQPGSWIALETALCHRNNRLLMHHQVDLTEEPGYRLEVRDAITHELLKDIACAGDLSPYPSLAHDSQSWLVCKRQGIELSHSGQIHTIPVKHRGGQFHPSRDLVAIPGELGFVAPAEFVAAQSATLALNADEQALRLRGYARMTTLPNRIMPPRMVVFAGPSGWLMQPEKLQGRCYCGMVDAIFVPRGSRIAETLQALALTLERAKRGNGELEPATAAEQRFFLGATVTPPSPGWTNAVAVSFASDAIELWPMKPVGDLAFEHSFYPVSALKPDVDMPAVIAAIETMLNQFRSRKGTGLTGPAKA